MLGVKFKGKCVAAEQDEPLAEHMGTGRMNQNPPFFRELHDWAEKRCIKIE